MTIGKVLILQEEEKEAQNVKLRMWLYSSNTLFSKIGTHSSLMTPDLEFCAICRLVVQKIFLANDNDDEGKKQTFQGRDISINVPFYYLALLQCDFGF